MNDPINKSVRIGKFDLWEFIGHGGKKSIWIGLADDGEGGAFNEAELEKVIEKFYDKNF
jgi:hypothetical protein